ncbi:MAG TPA: hypothetical protein PKN36_10030 [bacterium]|nr:hypothetical protein [bacterium]
MGREDPKPSIPASPIVFENNSGQGTSATIPVEIKRWNWGAFYLHWDSVEHFLRVQRNWSRWGLVFCIFISIVVLSVLAAIEQSVTEIQNSIPWLFD